jgi:predicted nucleic acid-binding protein
VTALVVDASVWVAATDPKAPHHAAAHGVLVEVAARQDTIFVPSLARVEVACALRRRLADADGALVQVQAFFSAPFIVEVALDRAQADSAVRVGVEQRLSGADAVYAALARAEDAVLLTLDRELLERADGVSPEEWLRANPRA